MNKLKTKIQKGLWVVVLMITMLTAQAGTMIVANAEDSSYKTKNGVVDFQEGDAAIVIKENTGQSLVGKKLQVHKLFEAENADGLESIDYTMNQTYANTLKKVVGSRLQKAADEVTEYEIVDYMQTLNSYIVEGAQAMQKLEGRYSDYRYFIEELTAQLASDNISGAMVEVQDTKSDNSIELAGLPYGYYMVEDMSDSSGMHTAISMPVLTTANPTSRMNIKADYPTLVEKIQEDDSRDTIGNDGWNDMADFEIGQDVPYRYQSNIPDINGYHTYYYAWHTQMDEALTLQEDTIQITITGTVASVSKTYQLKSEEYKLLTDTSEATFVIEIDDIKAIVDREFPNTNEKQENTYGQQVTVTYQATLNDKAALDTGRPGFENDVRLEFSNNPNSAGASETGFTPWDTVVCFTYQLNGLKINNYGMNLEGAVFRLYSDEACTEEIYVKKVSNRYHIMNPDSWDSTSPSSATEMVSDENGEFHIYGLDGGTYYLKEVTAPSGYRPLLEPVKVEINPVFAAERNAYVKGDGANGEVLTLSATAHIITFTNGTETEKDVTLKVNQEKGSMNLSIVNEVGEKLPITGSYAMPIFMILGVVLIGIAIRRGGKKHE